MIDKLTAVSISLTLTIILTALNVPEFTTGWLGGVTMVAAWLWVKRIDLK